MKFSKTIALLTLLIAIMTVAATAAGLFWQAAGDPFAFTTVRGQTAQIYGRGLYQFDTRFFAAGYRGQDIVALVLGMPLLIFALSQFRRGLLSGHLLLVGTLGYFLYLYASMALGTAYNPLFLLYIALFSASLFAFVLAFSTVDLQQVRGRALPRRGLATFMVAGGVITLLVWGLPLVSALLEGRPPERLDSYTTMVTYALDLAIITPATFVCAYLALKHEPLGYVIAAPLLTLIVLLAPQIALSTYFQRAAGVPFTTGEMVGPVAGFVVLGLLAAWLFVALLRSLHESDTDVSETVG
jgi:hypothetical protein